MRKSILSLLPALILIAGCAGDQITIIESGGNTGGTTSLTDPELSWSASSAEAVFDADNEFPTLKNTYGVSVSYSSSDEDVATVASDGTVTLVAAGSTIITAASDSTDTYSASSASYALKVSKAEGGLEWSSDNVSVVIGGDYTLPGLSNPNSLEVVFTSSDTGVAKVDSDGIVTVIADGTAIITATSEATAKYEGCSVSYTLTVSKSTDGISWSTNSCTVVLGKEGSFPTLNNPGNQTVSYKSSNTSVAGISSDGTVTVLSVGVTTITATSEENDNYTSTSVSYTLTVEDASSLLVSAELSWPSNSYSATMGSSFSSPSLSNPHSLSVTYTSSDTGVATVSANGTVTLVAAGTAIITATSEATDTYAAGSAFYTLTVSLADAGLSWSASSYTATLASTENAYPTLTNANGLEITYSSTNTSVAEVASDGTVTPVGAGTTTIVAASSATSTYSSGSASYILKVVKHDMTLSWSASTCTVVLEDGSANTFPTLSIDPASSGITVVYASSNSAVASVDASTGAITLNEAGSATISAAFAGDDYYKSASATYTLSVTSSADNGAVTTTFPSAGDTSSDDDISNTTFTRLVTVTYSSSGATVEGCTASGISDYFTVSTSGNQVTISYTGSENIVYKLSGTASDGFFKLYSSKKQAIWLSGVSITCSSGAAINNQSGKRTFVYVDGTNTLADGSSAAYSATGDEDMKGVFFSEGQLVFSGGGSLTVTANNKQSKSGIVSDDYVRFMSCPSVTVSSGSSAGHGIRGKEYVQLSDGTLSVTTQANMKKGIGSDDYVLVEGGTTTIKVSGGVAYDSDDAEYKGTAGIKADNYFAMTGGSVTITNSGKGGKGVSAGSYDYNDSHTLSDSYISGGTLNITTTGSESNDVSCKGIKIGWSTKSGNKVTGYAGNMTVSGGVIIIKCTNAEGFEAKGNLTFTGGETYVTSSGDDAINCQAEMNIKGGYVYAYSSANDAIDANHDLKLSGGYVFAMTTKGSPEVAIDANTEDGYKLYIESGATVVAYGGLESGYSASQSVYSMSCTAGSWNALHNGSSYIAAFKAPSGCSSVAVSAPSLSKGYTGVSVGGTTYCNGIWATSSVSGGSQVSLSTYNGGNSGGPGGNQPGGRH